MSTVTGGVFWGVPFSSKNGIAHLINWRGYRLCDHYSYVNPGLAQRVDRDHAVQCEECRILWEQPENVVLLKRRA